MPIDFDMLNREVQDLRGSRDRLADLLAASIDRLSEAGACFSPDVLQAAHAYQQQFFGTRRQLEQNLACPAEGLPHSLDAWNESLKYGRRQQQAALLLADAAALEVRNGSASAPLKEIADDVANMQSAAQRGDELPVDELLSGRHPLAALVSLVKAGADLSDSEWETQLDRVAAHYGRGLATQISRGKVSLAPASAAEQPVWAIAPESNREDA